MSSAVFVLKVWSIFFDIRDITDDIFSPCFDKFIENFIVRDLKEVIFLQICIFLSFQMLENFQF